MKGEWLNRQLRVSQGALHTNLEGLTHDESLRQPEPGGNCLNWVVGHILATRDRALGVLGGTPVMDKDQAARYVRGSRPIVDGNEAVRFETIVEGLDRSHERLSEVISRLDDEALARSVGGPFGDGPLGDALAVFQFHEAYHVGQTGILRRLVGKEGAIR